MPVITQLLLYNIIIILCTNF